MRFAPIPKTATKKMSNELTLIQLLKAKGADRHVVTKAKCHSITKKEALYTSLFAMISKRANKIDESKSGIYALTNERGVMKKIKTPTKPKKVAIKSFLVMRSRKNIQLIGKVKRVCVNERMTTSGNGSVCSE